MVVMVGVFCALMGAMMLSLDPLVFEPDPVLQALAWLGVGAWCFVIGWTEWRRTRR